MIKDSEFIWDEKETRAVRFSFIRNFTLDPGKDCINVLGWFNDSESFHLASFRTYGEAQDFLKKLFGKEKK